MIAITRVRLRRISKRSEICVPNCFNSSPISSRPIAVRRCKRSSRMARACVSLSRYVPPSPTLCNGSSINATRSATSAAGQSRAISCTRASAGDGALRISPITSSMFATAIASPTSTWARSRAFPNSNFDRRVTTSSRKAMKALSISRKFINCGRPPFSASMLAPKDVCNCE